MRERSLARMWYGYPKREMKSGLSRKLNISIDQLRDIQFLNSLLRLSLFVHNTLNTFIYFSFICILYTFFLSILLYCEKIRLYLIVLSVLDSRQCLTFHKNKAKIAEAQQNMHLCTEKNVNRKTN